MQCKNWAKYIMNNLWEEIKMANKHLQRCSTSGKSKLSSKSTLSPGWQMLKSPVPNTGKDVRTSELLLTTDVKVNFCHFAEQFGNNRDIWRCSDMLYINTPLICACNLFFLIYTRCLQQCLLQHSLLQILGGCWTNSNMHL